MHCAGEFGNDLASTINETITRYRRELVVLDGIQSKAKRERTAVIENEVGVIGIAAVRRRSNYQLFTG
jgi:hypothetical protein